MAARSPVYHPTPSQWASAALHLDTRDAWRTVRIDGQRYVALVSGSSGRVYLLRADAAGCACPWYVRTGRPCSHMLALELDATEDELREAAARAPQRPRPSYADVFPPCRACGELTDTRDGECDRCASDREWQARLAARSVLPLNLPA